MRRGVLDCYGVVCWGHLLLEPALAAEENVLPILPDRDVAKRQTTIH